MQLTQQTDYALRMLFYLAQTPDQEWVGVREISEAYKISHNHMLKVTQALVSHGFVESKRGAAGGVRLSMSPNLIIVGDVVRRIENNMGMAECMRGESSCPLLPHCVLKKAYMKATQAFLSVLDEYTVEDCATSPQLLKSLRALIAKHHNQP